MFSSFVMITHIKILFIVIVFSLIVSIFIKIYFQFVLLFDRFPERCVVSSLSWIDMSRKLIKHRSTLEVWKTIIKFYFIINLF